MVQVSYLRDEAMNFETLAIEGGAFGDNLSIQRGLKFDAEDIALGTATYCLSRGIGPTFYGGVRAWSLDDGTLALSLVPEAADALNAPPDLEYHFSPDDAAVVADHLPRLLTPGP